MAEVNLSAQSVASSKSKDDPDPAWSAAALAKEDITWDQVVTLFDILYEHNTGLLLRTAGAFQQIAKEDTLNFKGDSTSFTLPDGTLAHKFEYAEHRFLGDSLILPELNAGENGLNTAQYNPLTLDNGLKLTYGEINGLAGDFFGATNPISSGETIAARKQNFLTAFGFLASSATGKTKAKLLQAALKKEVDDVNQAIKSSGDNMEEVNKKVNEVYAKLPFDLKLFDDIGESNSAGPIYTELLKANVDHFGQFGRLAYNAGHACALEEAAKGNLMRAYAMNAFSDHFLEDNFASGHLRVPRKNTIRTDGTKLALLRNLSANVMHEEDGEKGLQVISGAGTESWRSYGDSKLFHVDQETTKATNMEHCRLALRQSVQEVYDAYKSKKVIAESDFGVWKYAPDLAKIDTLNPKQPPLLFLGKDQRLYMRNDSLLGPASICMDDRYSWIELALWAFFYSNNKQWVGDKLWKYLGMDKILETIGDPIAILRKWGIIS